MSDSQTMGNPGSQDAGFLDAGVSKGGVSGCGVSEGNIENADFPKEDSTWILLAGGGTAGHIFPGLAVAEYLRSKGLSPSRIHFATSRTGTGIAAIQQAGYPFTQLPGKGIKRSFRPRDIAANMASATKLVAGFFTAVRLLGKLRPKVILCLGGYVSFGIGKAALLWRIPVVVAEQNAVPGLANKLTAYIAKATAVSFPQTRLPRATFTGNPIRQEFQHTQSTGSESNPDLTELIHVERFHVGQFHVVVAGGSLGAGKLNQIILEMLAEIQLATQPEAHAETHPAAHPAAQPGTKLISQSGKLSTKLDPVETNFKLTHLVGEREWEHVSEVARQLQLSYYEPLPFSNSMAELLKSADLVVGRSGAGMVAEATATATPAIFIPLPGAPGDHQTKNAKAMADAGAAKIIPQRETSATKLFKEIRHLKDNPEVLAKMSRQAAQLAKPDAASQVGKLLIQHARKQQASAID